MKSKTLIAGLLIIAILISNVISVLVTYNLAANYFKGNTPICPTITSTPTDVTSTSTTPSATDSSDSEDSEKMTLVEIDSTSIGKIYKFNGYTIEIPNTYKITLEQDNSILIEPKVERFPTHFNHLRLFRLIDPIEIYANSAWDPSIDSAVSINGETYHKTASIWGEGGETTGNIIEWLEGEITYHTFQDSFFIKESIGASVSNYDVTKYDDSIKEIVLNPDGQQLIKEMDDILGSLKLAE